MDACHTSIDGFHNITKGKIKTRAIKVDNFLVGTDGADGQMIHITLKLMTGRSKEARQELANILYKVGQKYLPKTDFPKAALTVEIVELDKETYIP